MELVELKEIEEQVRDIQNMIKRRQGSLEILARIAAIKHSLDKIGYDLLRIHLDESISNLLEKTSEKDIQQELNEILKIIIEARKRM